VAEPLRVHPHRILPELEGRAEGLGRGRPDARAVRARVAELLAAVQLPPELADRYPHQLSGGQRQRASLARALALRPRLLIADEPTSALDVSVQAAVLELIARLRAEHGFAALFISHDLAVVEQLADRVVILREGAVVESGPAATVLAAPSHAYTRQLLDAVPVADPRRARRARATAS
jgi:peptide/nickel transport system ATP-binding protein